MWHVASSHPKLPVSCLKHHRCATARHISHLMGPWVHQSPAVSFRTAVRHGSPVGVSVLLLAIKSKSWIHIPNLRYGDVFDTVKLCRLGGSKYLLRRYLVCMWIHHQGKIIQVSWLVSSSVKKLTPMIQMARNIDGTASSPPFKTTWTRLQVP